MPPFQLTNRIKVVIHITRPTISPAVTIQLQRSEFIKRKVEDNLPDDSTRVVIAKEMRHKPSWRIHMSD